MGNQQENEQMDEWQPVETAPDGVTVMTKIDDERGVRNEQPLMRCRYLWWFPDRSMYTYYAPTHWRPLRDDPSHR